ncbi:hypothetical protein JCM30394_22470 [Deferrisoma palaeochoriense]
MEWQNDHGPDRGSWKIGNSYRPDGWRRIQTQPPALPPGKPCRPPARLKGHNAPRRSNP